MGKIKTKETGKGEKKTTQVLRTRTFANIDIAPLLPRWSSIMPTPTPTIAKSSSSQWKPTSKDSVKKAIRQRLVSWWTVEERWERRESEVDVVEAWGLRMEKLMECIECKRTSSTFMRLWSINECDERGAWWGCWRWKRGDGLTLAIYFIRLPLAPTDGYFWWWRRPICWAREDRRKDRRLSTTIVVADVAIYRSRVPI